MMVASLLDKTIFLDDISLAFDWIISLLDATAACRLSFAPRNFDTSLRRQSSSFIELLLSCFVASV